MNIFLDACAIIYLIEAKEPFYSKVRDTLQQVQYKFVKTEKYGCLRSVFKN